MKTYKLTENTLRERIRLYYVENLQLSKEDLRIKDRLEAAHALILDEFETDKNAVAFMMKRFSISQAQAYNDITMAKNIFGDVRSSNKSGIRYMVTQWATECIKKAVSIHDLDAMAKFMDVIIKANSLDKDDADIPDMSKIQPPVQLLSVNFSFINSPWFKLIDDAAQKAILQQYDEFMTHVKISPMAEYTDIWKIDESVRPKKKHK
jgi:hypothetical protein